MPTYQYRCTQCGTELEVVQKFSDPALTVCPECEGALRKVYSAVGVVFKGSGFYATDNRTKGRSSASSSSDTSGSGSSGDSKSGSDSSSTSSGSSSTPATSTSSASGSGSSGTSASAAAS